MRKVQVSPSNRSLHRMRRILFCGRSRRLHALPDARPAADAEASTDATADTAYATDATATDARSVEIQR